MKILVTGSNGQLGQEFQRISADHPEHTFTFTDIEQLDITDEQALSSFFLTREPDIVINCAAYTSVDKAETETGKAFALNAYGPGNIARVASKSDALLIHVSTDYVYNGEKNTPYTEEDTADPRSVYAKSKLGGELEIRTHASRAIILRTSWLYSEYNSNFVKTVLEKGSDRGELNIVYDQTGTPTWTADLARAVFEIIPVMKDLRGVELFQYSDEGVASWYDFAVAIVEFSGIRCTINPILTAEYPLPAARPAYSVMSKAKIRTTAGITVPYWRDSLIECIDRIRKKSH